MEERDEGEVRRVRARFRWAMVGNETGEESDWIGLERRERVVSCGR